MPKNLGPFTTWSQYLAARLAAMGVTSSDVRTSLDRARLAGDAMHALDAKHRRRARANIALAFPQWDARRVNLVARESFKHFVQLAVEVCYTPRILQLETFSRHVTFGPIGRFMDMMNAGQPLIMVTGHLGNWEVAGYLMGLLGYEMDAVARPLDNRLINDWVMGVRRARGMRIITKWKATDRMVGVLDRGGALAFIADQNAGGKGMFVPFFGRLASAYKSIGLLAIHQNVPVVCGCAYRSGRGFNFEFEESDVIMPDEWADQPEPLYYLTARYTRAIEQMIRRRPDQYLWMHRRWKSRPRHEVLGEPMPARLRRSLEQLPWMDQEQMDRLLAPGDESPKSKVQGPRSI